MKNIRSTGIRLFLPTIIALSLSACGGGGGDSSSESVVTPALAFADPHSTYELDNYSQTGNFALQVGTGNNLLNDEASGVAYDKDTDSLYVVGDGATSVVHISKVDGTVIDSLELDSGDFADVEGIAYIGGGKFALIEERIRQIDEFTYPAGGGLLTRGDVKAVKLGTSVGNNGIEGISFDPKTGGFIAVKQSLPEAVFQTNVDFDTGTSSNGSLATVSTDLFDPNATGLSTLNDVFALSNIVPATAPDYDNILIIGASNGLIVKMDRTGKLLSSLPMDVNGQNEGMTMGPDGTIYLVGELAGGAGKPGLTIFSPTTGKNNVGAGSNLYLTFNQPVQAGSGNIMISNGAGGTKTIPVTDTAQVSFSGNTVKINPTTNLAGGANYSITYAAGVFRTASGSNVSAVSSTATLGFTTTGTPDAVAPALNSSLPANGATNVTGNHLALTFNEAVQAGTGKIMITGSDGDSRQIDINDAQIKFSANTANINLTDALHPGATYTVQVASGVITDLAGNAFASTTFGFSTAAVGATAPTLLITEVNSNANGGDFFELYNYGASAIDISGWKWGDDHLDFNSAGNSTAFLPGTTIQPGKRLVVVNEADETAFRAAWGGLAGVDVFAAAGAGLGGGDVVILYDSAAKVVTWFNFEGVNLDGTSTPIVATDGTVLTPAVAAPGSTAAFPNHAGIAFGAVEKSVSAVWDGVSTTSPQYKAAVAGDLGAFVPPGDVKAIGSPGQ